MMQAIGLVELKSIPLGIKTADEMLKAGNVELLLATPICPGKYVIIVSGDVGSVEIAVSTGERIAEIYLVGSNIINNVDPSLPSAIAGTTKVEQAPAVGVIETISALTSVMAGDIAAKASAVSLIEIRIARGLGGKGFLTFAGEVSAVNAAMDSCLRELKSTGEITSYSVLSSPHKDLVKSLV